MKNVTTVGFVRYISALLNKDITKHKTNKISTKDDKNNPINKMI